MSEIRIGQIGGLGWMGHTHAFTYAAVAQIFGIEPAVPVLEIIAEADEALSREAAKVCGARRWTADWRELVADPDVDVVDIVTPNNMHYEMALAAIAEGKDVYCEKPLALNARESGEMAEAAAKKGVRTLVGYNYPHHPVHAIAKSRIEAGELGDIVHARLSLNVDFLADPEGPFIWRCDKATAGSGIIGDGAGHLFGFTQYLIGDVAEVCGNLETVVAERPVIEGAAVGREAGEGARRQMRTVDTDDSAQVILRFANGATGIMDSSRVHTGTKLEIGYDIVGSKGALRWSYDRMNELQVYDASDPVDRQGFQRVEVGPSHPYYGAFYPVPNLGFGYNDMKLVEVRKLVEGIAGDGDLWPDFAVGHQIQRTIDAVIASHEQRRWVKVSEIA